MSETNQDQSPLVKAVLALDSHLTELERLGAKINTMDLKSEFDFAHAQRLMGQVLPGMRRGSNVGDHQSLQPPRRCPQSRGDNGTRRGHASGIGERAQDRAAKETG